MREKSLGGHPATARRRHGISAVLAAALGLGEQGCSNECPTPCAPPPFDVTRWCIHTGRCTAPDEFGAPTCFGGELRRGDTAEIPVIDFFPALGATQRDLSVYFLEPNDGSPIALARDAIVIIGGVPAEYRADIPLGSRSAVFSWTEFPDAPQVLEVRFEGGPDRLDFVGLKFTDIACERANPRLCDDEE